LINENYLLNENNVFCNKKLFNQEYIKDLNSITLHGPISSEFISFANNLTKEITQDYNISWKNKNEITLTDKNENITLLINYNHIPSKKLLEACKTIKKENELLKKIKDKFVADLRFEKQIIIRS